MNEAIGPGCMAVNESPLAKQRPRHALGRFAELPRISPWLLRWFHAYARRYLARHFHAVRVTRETALAIPPDVPLVVFMNHPGWWDPLVGLVLSRACFPDRTHYAVMESAALDRYRFFQRLGFVGVEVGTRRGAGQFFRLASTILDRPATALWMTPEGRFSDPRQPSNFCPGLAHLARRLPRGALLPVAVEYPFWEERSPEALVAIGKPILLERSGPLSVDDWNERLQTSMDETKRRLAAMAVGRQADAFEVLIRGSAGVGGVYDAWRRLWAWVRGETFLREHGGRP